MFAFENDDSLFSARRWMRIIRTRAALGARAFGTMLGRMAHGGPAGFVTYRL
jgi:hypothetical protein